MSSGGVGNHVSLPTSLLLRFSEQPVRSGRRVSISRSSFAYVFSFRLLLLNSQNAFANITESGSSMASSLALSDGRGGTSTGTAVILILTEPPPGDFDGDFQSGPEDVVPFAEAFGMVAGEGNFDPAFDVNGNGVVDFFDFLALLELWAP